MMSHQAGIWVFWTEWTFTKKHVCATTSQPIYSLQTTSTRPKKKKNLDMMENFYVCGSNNVAKFRGVIHVNFKKAKTNSKENTREKILKYIYKSYTHEMFKRNKTHKNVLPKKKPTFL